MWGWIIVGVLYFLGGAMFWLFETDGGNRDTDLCDWLVFIFWFVVVTAGLAFAFCELVSEWWGCRKAYKRGYKDGHAGKTAKPADYPQWYYDGYVRGI